ncbi:uncharacterized protein TNCV_3729471 [Trichonephila clavipes]|nr:uncharacterized protein TNCV_3729471 [Trichonephila clavipes]
MACPKYSVVCHKWHACHWFAIPVIDPADEEYCFQLCTDNHRRRPGKLADPTFTIARHTGPEPGVMIWSSISFDSQTPLVVIRGNLEYSARWLRGNVSSLIPKDVGLTAAGFNRFSVCENRRYACHTSGDVVQKDGATCHTARATIDLLKDTFGDRLISRFGPVNWPPRSCDLTPLDYFLWGYVKSLVYVDKPQTLDPLEDNIGRVIADVRPQMLEKVIENWTSRLDYIRASRGSPMPEILFIIIATRLSFE